MKGIFKEKRNKDKKRQIIEGKIFIATSAYSMNPY
jgi:hypothetical protein